MNPVVEIKTDQTNATIESGYISAETEGIGGLNTAKYEYFKVAAQYCSITPKRTVEFITIDLVLG